MNRTQARKWLEHRLAWAHEAVVDGCCPRCKAAGEVTSWPIEMPTDVVDFDGREGHVLVFPHAEDCPRSAPDTIAAAEEIFRLCRQFGFRLQPISEGPFTVEWETRPTYSFRLVDDGGE